MFSRLGRIGLFLAGGVLAAGLVYGMFAAPAPVTMAMRQCSRCGRSGTGRRRKRRRLCGAVRRRDRILLHRGKRQRDQAPRASRQDRRRQPRNPRNKARQRPPTEYKPLTGEVVAHRTEAGECGADAIAGFRDLAECIVFDGRDAIARPRGFRRAVERIVLGRKRQRIGSARSRRHARHPAGRVVSIRHHHATRVQYFSDLRVVVC